MNISIRLSFKVSWDQFLGLEDHKVWQIGNQFNTGRLKKCNSDNPT